MRIVGGRHAGLDLVSPGRRVRPTAETVRDRWMRRLETDLAGARVLDLFAGSGALGLEAFSRGAAAVDFVENGAGALHALKANVARMRLPASRRSSLRIFKRDAIPFVEALAAGAYDVALADPPYGSRKLDRVVSAWLRVPYARILTVEHGVDVAVEGGRRIVRAGDTAVTAFGPAAPARRRAD